MSEEPLGPPAVPVLGIAVTGLPGGRRLTVVGELDIATEAILVDALAAGLAVGNVEVDLTGLSFMDSSGIRALLRAHESGVEGHRVSVIAASPQARRLFDIVGVGELLGLPGVADESSTTVSGQQARLAAVLARVVHTVDGCDTASITVRKGPHTFTSASYDEVAFDLDQAQYAEDSGPCLSAFRSLEVVALSRIVSGPGRYERYRERAVAAGIRSSVSAPFKANARLRGSLNLYSSSADAFGEDAEEAVASFCDTLAELLDEPT